jgi:hypothetical protein
VNLPNYFLADLSADAELTPTMITEACQTLKRNRLSYLEGCSTASLVNVLCELAHHWLDENYPLRKLALEEGPAATGFSRPTLTAGLDGFFRQFTLESFHALLEQELGHSRRLDELVSTEGERAASRAALARGPELLVHIAAGNIPNPALTSLVLGLLVRSAQFIKCASGAAFLPLLFAHSLREADPKLAACLEVAVWRRGKSALDRALHGEADALTATGNDETLASLKALLPAHVRFLGYGHRVSFGYVTNGVMTSFFVKKIVAQAAADIAAWNQLGCLSPHAIYVEHGGAVPVEEFAGLLAEELGRVEADLPRGQLPDETAATIASRRAFYEIRAAHSPDTLLWQSHNSTAWTVVYESDPLFQHSCLHRFVYVKGVGDLSATLQGADSVRGKVSTVGLAARPEQVREFATQLARWGVTRVCPLGRMQEPPLTWRHDGRPALADLLTWSDWEHA